MYKFRLFRCALLSLGFSLAASSYAQCPQATPGQTYFSSQRTWQSQWLLEDADVWLSQHAEAQDAELIAYWDFVNEHTDIDPWLLLARQKRIYENAFGKNDPSVKKFELMESGSVAQIQPISCLSAFLMTEQLKYHPLNDPPSEFSAQVFRKGQQLRVYAAFHQHPSVAAPAVANAQAIHEGLIADGWTFLIFLHNHPFNFNNPYGDIAGTVIPSDPDLQTFWRMFETRGLQEAWITNGFDTARFQKPGVARLLSVD